MHLEGSELGVWVPPSPEARWSNSPLAVAAALLSLLIIHNFNYDKQVAVAQQQHRTGACHLPTRTPPYTSQGPSCLQVISQVIISIH